MNLAFLESTSIALQQLCKELGILYNASIISNGTCWPSNINDFIVKHKVRQIQISFDGLKANHDKRRRYRKEYKTTENQSSFELAVALVDQLVQVAHVDIRYNMDRNNVEDLMPFIDFVKEKKWFDGPYPAVFQPARLASYSEKSSFMRKSELTVEEFDHYRQVIRDKINNRVLIEESEAPDGFPYPKFSVCAALANNSVVVGAEGATYRCGLQVGELNRAVGNIRDLGFKIVNEDQNKWWEDFDPTNNKNCSKCSFLPICWGGCPKKHLEEDSHAIAEQGAYWRNNLPRLVAAKFNKVVKSGFVITNEDQFRDK